MPHLSLAGLHRTGSASSGLSVLDFLVLLSQLLHTSGPPPPLFLSPPFPIWFLGSPRAWILIMQRGSFWLDIILRVRMVSIQKYPHHSPGRQWARGGWTRAIGTPPKLRPVPSRARSSEKPPLFLPIPPHLSLRSSSSTTSISSRRTEHPHTARHRRPRPPKLLRLLSCRSV